MQTPLISLTAVYIAGILAGHGFLYFPFSICTLVFLIILTSGVLTLSGRLTRHRFLISVIPAIIGMAAYVYSAAWLPADHYTRLFPASRTPHVLEGTISSPLDRDPGRTAFIVNLRCIDGTPVRGSIRVGVREELSSLGYGDLVRITSKMREPGSFMNPGGFDYAAYLARNGVFAMANVRTGEDIALLKRGTGIFRTIQDWRERIRQAFLAETRGAGSAILQAMVLGEEGGLTDELRDRFQSAGVTHIISISGSHLGTVALLCFGLVRGLLLLLPERLYHHFTLAADPRKLAASLTFPLVVFYTLLAGGQIATVRALIMIAAGLGALVLDRDRALANFLAIAALLILVSSPRAVFDISFQLSYLSVLVIGYVVSVWNDIGIGSGERRHKFVNSVALLIMISLATSLSTGPLVAHYFNQFSLAGIVSNLVIVPFAGAVVVPLGLVSGLLSLFTNHLPLAWLNQLVSDIFIGLVAFFSRLPFAEFHPPAPGILWLILYALFFLSLLLVLRILLLARFKPFEGSARIPRVQKVTLMLTGPLLLLSLVFSFLPRTRTAISFPDVGQGDCSLIGLRSGKTILIDGGGTADNRFDIGKRVVAPFLWNHGISRLDLVVLSHPHPDHMNGLLFVLRKFPVGEVWASGLDTDLPGYDEFLRIIAGKGIPLQTVSAEDAPVSFGGAELSILHPSQNYRARERKEYAAQNNRSLVLRVADGSRNYLFCGDVGTDGEAGLVMSQRSLTCDVLKIPHHGSKSSSSEEFVRRTKPGLAVATVGRDNPYHHPADEVVERYERAGSIICRTDRDGAVMIRLHKDRMEVTRWSEMLLERVSVYDFSCWRHREWRNMRRLWIRTWEI